MVWRDRESPEQPAVRGLGLSVGADDPDQDAFPAGEVETLLFRIERGQLALQLRCAIANLLRKRGASPGSYAQVGYLSSGRGLRVGEQLELGVHGSDLRLSDGRRRLCGYDAGHGSLGVRRRGAGRTECCSTPLRMHRRAGPGRRRPGHLGAGDQPGVPARRPGPLSTELWPGGGASVCSRQSAVSQQAPGQPETPALRSVPDQAIREIRPGGLQVGVPLKERHHAWVWLCEDRVVDHLAL